jgi:hypothetical protein
MSNQLASPRHSTWLTCVCLLVSAIAVAGSLWLSLGMNLKPCPLCYYQRTFILATLGVLLLGSISGAARTAPVSLLALPAAAGGLGVAIWHEYLELVGKLECPAGIAGIGSAPQQSLTIIVLLFVVLLLDTHRSRVIPGSSFLATCGAVLLGFGLAFAGIKSVPPPTIPTKAYEGTIDICRPPYHAPKAS